MYSKHFQPLSPFANSMPKRFNSRKRTLNRYWLMNLIKSFSLAVVTIVSHLNSTISSRLPLGMLFSAKEYLIFVRNQMIKSLKKKRKLKKKLMNWLRIVTMIGVK